MLLRSFASSTQQNNIPKSEEVLKSIDTLANKELHNKLTQLILEQHMAQANILYHRGSEQNQHKAQLDRIEKQTKRSSSTYFLGIVFGYFTASSLISYYMRNSGDWVITKEEDASGEKRSETWTKTFNYPPK